ncbi:hypothetical protein PF011_g10530 [Phytophthora fragariae]|uniref:Uncharacterized protein n=1 Tax=Phytophthora fragariae TaxID=53985 RepID=A0A6A3KN81_9STRA|nr:hypothetical protein PF011_g10530 [Phytophthora fragariae]
MSDRNSKLLARFQKCLDEEAKNEARDQEQEAWITKTMFWSETRDLLAVNSLSSGLDILDDMAKALIYDTGRAAQSLSGTVTILPHPSTQSVNTGATPHPSFTSTSKKRPVPAKQAKGSAAKKHKASASPKSSPVASGTALITFPLALGLPKEFEFKPDFSPLMDDDGKPTALSWATAMNDCDTKYRPDPDEEVEEELADEESKAEAAQQEEEEEEESEGEDEVPIL